MAKRANVGGNAEERRLRRLYTTASHPASFSSAVNLARAARLPLKQVRQWLRSNEVYTTHFPARVNSKNVGFYNIYFPNQLWETDLNDLARLVESNYPFKYCLTVIDVFSKQAQARPLKTKESREVARAMEDIFKQSGVHPYMLQSDEGGEYMGKEFQALMKKYGIKFRVARNKHKASTAERLNRTLKQRLFRYLSWKETERWVDVLPQIVQAYNKAPHRSLGGIAPNEVNRRNAYSIWKHNYLTHMGERARFRENPAFAIGDFVRISKHRGAFDKSYKQSFTTEVYKIHQVYLKNGVYMFELQSLAGDVLRGLCYTHELVRVFYVPSATFKIESILDRRSRADGKEEVLVKWKSWHPSHNS